MSTPEAARPRVSGCTVARPATPFAVSVCLRIMIFSAERPMSRHRIATNLGVRQADYGAANILLLDTPDIGALIAPRQLVVTWGTADPLFKGTDDLQGQSVTCLQNAYMGQYDNGRKIGTYDIYATRF